MATTYIMYKIKCGDDNIEGCYIGSTKDFKGRKHSHKSHCNNENDKKYNLRVYKFIRENGGWNEFEMKPIEEFLCDTKLQATIREQYWINFYNSDLNSINSYTSEEQGKIQEKEYYENNKDKIKEQNKEYRENNKDKIKEYYENNKEEIKGKKSKLHICECGSNIRIDGKAEHSRTLKHQNFIKNQ